jgi:hypothetical protein
MIRLGKKHPKKKAGSQKSAAKKGLTGVQCWLVKGGSGTG